MAELDEYRDIACAAIIGLIGKLTNAERAAGRQRDTIRDLTAALRRLVEYSSQRLNHISGCGCPICEAHAVLARAASEGGENG